MKDQLKALEANKVSIGSASALTEGCKAEGVYSVKCFDKNFMKQSCVSKSS